MPAVLDGVQRAGRRERRQREVTYQAHSRGDARGGVRVGRFAFRFFFLLRERGAHARAHVPVQRVFHRGVRVFVRVVRLEVAEVDAGHRRESRGGARMQASGGRNACFSVGAKRVFRFRKSVFVGRVVVVVGGGARGVHGASEGSREERRGVGSRLRVDQPGSRLGRREHRSAHRLDALGRAERLEEQVNQRLGRRAARRCFRSLRVRVVAGFVRQRLYAAQHEARGVGHARERRAHVRVPLLGVRRFERGHGALDGRRRWLGRH